MKMMGAEVGGRTPGPTHPHSLTGFSGQSWRAQRERAGRGQLLQMKMEKMEQSAHCHYQRPMLESTEERERAGQLSYKTQF